MFLELLFQKMPKCLSHNIMILILLLAPVPVQSGCLRIAFISSSLNDEGSLRKNILTPLYSYYLRLVEASALMLPLDFRKKSVVGSSLPAGRL